VKLAVEAGEQNIKFRGYLEVAKGIYRVESDWYETTAGIITQCIRHGKHSIIELNGWKLTL
jgi:hypothetical protein